MSMESPSCGVHQLPSTPSKGETNLCATTTRTIMLSWSVFNGNVKSARRAASSCPVTFFPACLLPTRRAISLFARLVLWID